MGTGQYPDVFSICDGYSVVMTEVETMEAAILGRWPVCTMISPESWEFEYAMLLNPA
jgi:hypothetical protein